jgi:hypothetical protein
VKFELLKKVNFKMGDQTGLAGIQKLKGRENYSNWVIPMQSYLEDQELWAAVEGKETDAKKILKAKSKLILS